MKGRCDASVIVCVKNGEEFLLQQLEAIAAQETTAAFEVIIVNNGSTDSTAEIISDWEKALNGRLEVRVFDQPLLKNIPAVRNFAAQQARGDIIMFCDADDQVADTWVDAFLEKMRGREVLAGGLIEAYSADGTYQRGVFPQGLIGTRYLPHVGNCNCAVTRSLFFEVGGYDESLPRYGFEDVDFSWRVQEAGYPIEFVEKAKIRFRLSGTASSMKKKFLLGQGRVLMARRYPSYDSTSYTPLLCLRRVTQLSFYILYRAFKRQPLSRRDFSVLISSIGNLYGSVVYSGRNRNPRPRLTSVQ